MEQKLYKIIYQNRNLLQFIVACGFIYLGGVLEAGAPIIIGFAWALVIITNRFITVLKDQE